jgi:2,3-bisphosphoglycerate-dependent phosphoglycerate mutase
MELILIRHGLPETIHDAGGPADPGLAPEGHDQARRVTAWLSHEQIDAVYTSPLRRARETADPIAAHFGHDVVVDDELAEYDRDSHFYIPLEDLKASGDPRWHELIAGASSEAPAPTSLGGDVEVDPFTFRDVVVLALERVIEANPSRRVAVSCHGGVINAYASHVLGINRPLFFMPGYTSVSRFMAARSGERSVISLNETAHLRATIDHAEG